MDFAYLGTILLLVFGFGLVIFWHELGHFLAAKWAGVKVEQFAVGFGHAMLSWRKGMGYRWGSSTKEYESRINDYFAKHENVQPNTEHAEYHTPQQIDRAVQELGLGETEYRLNWIPLGGYVKMLGQDDLRPNAGVEDPRAYNNKPIPQRMVIVSAGVIMNVILAVILFAILFRMGFTAPPAVVGLVQPGSPAQEAGLQVGDRILYFDDRFQHDFTKISLSVALAEEGLATPVLVKRADGTEQHLTVLPRRTDPDPAGFLQIGIGPSLELRGPDPRKFDEQDKALLADSPVQPGETIVAIEGQPVAVKDYHALNRAVQSGRPVNVTVQDAQGNQSQRQITASLVQPFGKTPLNFAGMVPRTVVAGVEPGSAAKGKLLPGDIIEQITVQPTNDTKSHPALDTLQQVLNNAGQNKLHVDLVVIRDGQPVTLQNLDPTMRLEKKKRGLGIMLSADEDHAVIAGVLPGSAAEAAAIPAGATITAIAGQPVADWRDVQRILAASAVDEVLPVVVDTAPGHSKTFEMKLTAAHLAAIRSNRYAPNVNLHELTEPRQTSNPLKAAAWGVAETRDLMVQFYLTIRRMIQGSVAPSNMMGPLGIFHQGSRIAYRGLDWLIWFLAMISANLAVVNFLPIPIVDGGLFMFLILEKIMGKPLSPKAQSVAQVIGLALIAGVFLFVTYHDIARLFS